MSSSNNKAAVAAVLAVAAVVVASLVLVQTLGGEGGAGVSSAGDSPTQARSESPPPGGLCEEAPPAPGEPQQFDEVPDPATAENARWTATLTTNCGDIVLELDGKRAPQAVASFLHLAREDYWDDSPCHRLVTSGIFVLQCGDPSGTGSGGPGYGYGVENAPKDSIYPRGTLAMARTQDPESNGGQFFVVYKKTELPDPNGYTIFGKVTKGMRLVDRVAELGTGGSLGPEAPRQPISILDVSVDKAA